MLTLILKTFLLSMLPIGELRAAIPYGIYNELHIPLVYIVAVIGNMVPVFFLLWLLPYFEKWCIRDEKSRYAFLKPLVQFYLWLIHRTRRKYTHRFERLGALALITFVAIPFPITGAWTGTLAAHLFGIPPKKAIPLLFVGVLIAGLIVTVITLGIL